MLACSSVEEALYKVSLIRLQEKKVMSQRPLWVLFSCSLFAGQLIMLMNLLLSPLCLLNRSPPFSSQHGINKTTNSRERTLLIANDSIAC